MLKSPTVLLLLGACVTISYAGCLNRDAQNTLAHFELPFTCVDSCTDCGSFEGCFRDHSGECDSFICYADDPTLPAPVPVPALDRRLAAETYGCVDDCSLCSGGSFCAWDPLSCPSEGFPFKCDRGYKAPVAPQYIERCFRSCTACPSGSSCRFDPMACRDLGYSMEFPYFCHDP
ncbi:MAG: hypothetical protein J3Q66DRAFT_415131 [Benniella sp.]|nr:MAG: hypothetical protein J3Q66DRAFT_415131 [Benniella sp.]